MILVTVAAVVAPAAASSPGTVGWGFSLAAFLFVASLAIGSALVAVMCRTYGLTGMQPFFRRSVFTAMAAAVVALGVLTAVVEAPWRLIVYNAVSPNVTANFWWLVTLLGIMAGCLFMEFAVLVHPQAGGRYIFGFIAAVAGFGANNNLAALTAGAVDPPMWHGVQPLVLFLASTVLAGVSLAVVTDYAMRRLYRQPILAETREAYRTAAVVMQFMLVILAGILAVRLVTALRTPEDSGREVAFLLLTGRLAPGFWLLEVAAGILAPLALTAFSDEGRPQRLCLAGALALVGVFAQRFDLVAAARLLPRLAGYQPVPSVRLLPTVVECAVLALALAALTLFLLAGERYLRLGARPSSQPSRNPLR